MRTSTRVGLIGAGAIGDPVATALRSGAVQGCELGGILTRRPRVGEDGHVARLPELLERCDLVVEAAGHDALAEHGADVLTAGRDLLVVSTGALADDALRQRLWGAGPGRLLLSSGAIGGLELLRAAARAGALERVAIATTKPARVLVQDWMDDDLAGALRDGAEPVTAFDGPAREAVRRFPTSVNVAATVALATIGFERTEVRVIGDPRATVVEHVLTASGAAGAYEFRIRNRPSPDNPRTSAVVPHAVLRALADRGARVVVGA